jgi:hypothetical protein
MYLGHGGHPCPNALQQSNLSPWSNLGAMEDVFAHGEEDTIYKMQLELSNLVIVHSTRVYSHRVSWCQCPGAEKDRHLHLLKAKLFPTSITCLQSAFTFNVLDNFLIDALECKTSAMSFYQMLHCFTNNAFPHTIPVSNFFIIAPHAYMIKRIATMNLCGCLIYGGIWSIE